MRVRVRDWVFLMLFFADQPIKSKLYVCVWVPESKSSLKAFEEIQATSQVCMVKVTVTRIQLQKAKCNIG